MGMPVCENCKYYVTDSEFRSSVCARPGTTEALVSHKIAAKHGPPPTIERSYGFLWARIFNACGREGRFYVYQMKD